MTIYKSILVTISIFSLFSFSLFMAVPTAYACMCLPGTRSPQEELETSSAVFSGTVTGTSRSLLGLEYKARFDVDKIWKGISEKNVVVSTGIEGGLCGVDFKEGEKYIVYAYGKTSSHGESSLRTTSCSSTHLLTPKDTDVSALGNWKTPIKPNLVRHVSTVGFMIALIILVGVIHKTVVSSRKLT